MIVLFLKKFESIKVSDDKLQNYGVQDLWQDRLAGK